jgi:transposase
VLSFLSNTRVYHAAGATDLRKSFDTLAGVVRESLRLDPLSGHLFVFTNSRKNRIKILFWDNTGWWLCAKRLEAGTLAWPVSPSSSIELSSEELTLLLSGIDLSKTHRRPWLQRGPKNGSAQREKGVRKGVKKGSVLDIVYSPPSFLRRYKRRLR